jgi:hypothetical protein
MKNQLQGDIRMNAVFLAIFLQSVSADIGPDFFCDLFSGQIIFTCDLVHGSADAVRPDMGRASFSFGIF